MNFTASQQRAIGFGSANLQLIACAGSGKTEVVAQRVLHSTTFAMTLEIDRGEVLSATDDLSRC
jgi:ATP-dependent exoDNAse (exonuclease V) beta subunit